MSDQRTPSLSRAGAGRHGRGQGSVQFVHVGRQPIYDAAGDLEAYELLFRRTRTSVHCREPCLPTQEWDDDATAATIVAAFSAFDARELLGGRRGFVNLGRNFLTGLLPVPFEPSDAVLEVLERVAPDEETTQGLRRLADEGFVIALDDFVPRPGMQPLLELCSIVKVDVLAAPWDQVVETAELAIAHDARLLAECVEDEAVMQRCVDLGFELFQGFYLGRPQTLTATTLNPGQTMLLRLLAQLGDPGITPDALELTLREDPALTYRLLKIANSAAAATRRKVTSVREAVMLVGLRRLQAWTVLLAQAGSVTDREGLGQALLQAHLCENLAASGRHVRPDVAFTAGVLDGVARALGLCSTQLPDMLPVLGSELAAALRGWSCPLGDVLAASRGYLRHDLDVVLAAGYDVQQACEAYLAALAQATRAQMIVGG